MNPLLMLGWQRYLVYGALLLAAASVVWMHGYFRGEIKLHEYIAEQAVARVAIVVKIQKVREEVRVEHTKTVTKIETVFVKIKEESANVPSRAACNTTYGWLYGHNAAAAARDPDGRLDDQADTGVTEATALSVVQANYKAFHLVAADLKACRAYVSGLSKSVLNSSP